MRVLVTGSSGRLGREIVKCLHTHGIETTGIDVSPASTTSRIIDIRNVVELSDAVEQATHIIHTAALHGKHYDLNVPRIEFVKTNVFGTLNLLNLAVRFGIEKLVYTSTTSIYGKAMGDPEKAVWVDETLVPIPRDIYDITKQAAENLCRDFFEKEGLPTCVLRVSRFMEEPPNSIANYRLYRGLDESDCAHAHYLALNASLQSFEIFNISNKSPFSKDDLVELKFDAAAVIKKNHPEAAELYAANAWTLPESIDRVYDISKAEEMLNYHPTQNFPEYVTSQLNTDPRS